MITGYLCDLHRGTATEVQAYTGSRGLLFVCSDCWNSMADEERWKYLPVPKSARRVKPEHIRRFFSRTQ